MWQQALDAENIKLITIFGVGGAIAIVAIVFSSLRAIFVNRAKEQTKRELAAYVAEGTLDPDKAVAIINSGKNSSGKGSSCC